MDNINFESKNPPVPACTGGKFSQNTTICEKQKSTEYYITIYHKFTEKSIGFWTFLQFFLKNDIIDYDFR